MPALKITDEQKAILLEIEERSKTKFSFLYPGYDDRYVVDLGRYYLVGDIIEIMDTWFKYREMASAHKCKELPTAFTSVLLCAGRGPFYFCHVIRKYRFPIDVRADEWLEIVKDFEPYVFAFLRSHMAEINDYQDRLEAERNAERAKKVKREMRGGAWSKAAQNGKQSPLGQLAAFGIIA